MRVMANLREFNAIIKSAIQLFVTAHHVNAGNGIRRTINERERNAGFLQHGHPALSMMHAVTHIGNQIMKNMFSIVVINQPPEFV